jgi:hypothetical protein
MPAKLKIPSFAGIRVLDILAMKAPWWKKKEVMAQWRCLSECK